MFESIKRQGHARSLAVLCSLETRLDRFLQSWLLLAGLACAVRIISAPLTDGGATLGTITPYVLLIVAPFASTLLALRWFEDADQHAQPSTRLAFVGRWRSIGKNEATAHPLFGTSGIMVSLLVGMLLNVPMRAAEYLAAMPPVPRVAPHWLSTLHFAMSLDVVLFSSLYMIAFVAALRRAPLFPRLLVAIWTADLAMQLGTASVVAGTDGLPPAVAESLRGLLEGNAKKVLISAALWLPYLLLSKRVNVTYRNRVPA
ncbi:MAG: DUF2569 family protein [Sphingomicrobium sp.]